MWFADCRSDRTSESETSPKSSYHSPTARKSPGACKQISSSAIGRKLSHVSLAPTGTAIVIRPTPIRRNARTAAHINARRGCAVGVFQLPDSIEFFRGYSVNQRLRNAISADNIFVQKPYAAG